MPGEVHIIGAGLAGLACAVRLAAAGRGVKLYEAAPRAGGRCRSFRDRNIDRVIDNGNHLLLSGNTSALAYLDEIGAGSALSGAEQAAIPFVDLEDGSAWTLRPGPGRFPWWVFAAGRRVPGGTGLDHLGGFYRLWRAGPATTVAGALAGNALFRRLWEPLAVAVLNTPAETGSARLLWRVMAEVFGQAGGARPLAARGGLGPAFVEPALEYLAGKGVEPRFGARLRRIVAEGDRITELRFSDSVVKLAEGDMAVLAIPDFDAASILPGLATPGAHHAIVNAHFRLDGPVALPGDAPLLGLVGGAAQWIFARGDVASVTVSAADELAERDADAIARLLWKDVAAALDLPVDPVPPCRVIKEKRATFAQTPEQAARRPGTVTPAANLLLAGDWTDTGLPATIEGAIRSGHAAAAAILDGA